MADDSSDPKSMLRRSMAIAMQAAQLRESGNKKEARLAFLRAANLAETGLYAVMRPPLMADNMPLVSALILQSARCLAAGGQYAKALAYTGQSSILRLDPAIVAELQAVSRAILARHRKTAKGKD